jgi:hypothetical protein
MLWGTNQIMRLLTTHLFLKLILLAGRLTAGEPAPSASTPMSPTVQTHTEVSVSGDRFFINGKATYEGGKCQGKPIEGLLLNSRMVQGIFDDLNPDTVTKWVYPDTGRWDAERNTDEFIAAMPTWRAHGLLAFTINLQGGSPEGYSKSQPWFNSAIAPDGSLRPDYLSRLSRIINAADRQGMVVILGYFYFGQDERIADETAVVRAVDNATQWVLEHGWRNVMIEVNNECNVRYDHEILKPARVHELIQRVKGITREGRRLLVSTSYGGGTIPEENVVRAADFILIHGNGVSDPARIAEMVRLTRKVPGYAPKPILFNEDDHFDFDQPVNNFLAAIGEFASWGYFDFRQTNEPMHAGYQSVPVDWSIDSPRKLSFFKLLAEITGSAKAEVEPTVSLNGTWRLEPAGEPEREVTVPGFWERLPGLGNAHQATYRREFEIPPAFAGQRVFLTFDAVGDAAEVFVNGQHAGGHIGAGLPFSVDITALVTIPSASNRLEVMVRDDSYFSAAREGGRGRSRKHWIPRGMGANNRKGLYQKVTLNAVPIVRIADARITTSVRYRELCVVYEIFNGRKETLSGSVAARVVGDDGTEVFSLTPASIEAPGFMVTTVTNRAPFAKVQLWQPDHPALYHLQTTLADAKGTPLHQLQTRFGFRETWFEGIHFYLNGIRCNLRGESPAYAEKTDLFATHKTATDMIQRYFAANCNVLRFHAMPAPPQVLEVCDELGMMVIDESAIYASWQMLMPEHPDWMTHCREHLTRWVRRDRNHPAVILWSGDNEGLNVNALTPAMLADFKRVIDASDGSRPVIFDGDGSAYGVSPASVKHYVRTLEDLKERGGRSSGYAKDLRNDIYWATEYHQDIPLGCGEFLFPYEPGLRGREREVIYSMGLQARGYRLADWFDIRPYNPSYSGFLRKEGVREEHREAYDILVKSFAPIAVFDQEYDALGPFPKPPTLKAGETVKRTLIVYNDAFTDEQVQVRWTANLVGQTIGSGDRTLKIPLGGHSVFEITFKPAAPGELRLELTSAKGGALQFSDFRVFRVEDTNQTP